MLVSPTTLRPPAMPRWMRAAPVVLPRRALPPLRPRTSGRPGPVRPGPGTERERGTGSRGRSGRTVDSRGRSEAERAERAERAGPATCRAGPSRRCRRAPRRLLRRRRPTCRGRAGRPGWCAGSAARSTPTPESTPSSRRSTRRRRRPTTPGGRSRTSRPAYGVRCGKPAPTVATGSSWTRAWRRGRTSTPRTRRGPSRPRPWSTSSRTGYAARSPAWRRSPPARRRPPPPSSNAPPGTSPPPADPSAHPRPPPSRPPSLARRGPGCSRRRRLMSRRQRSPPLPSLRRPSRLMSRRQRSPPLPSLRRPAG